MENHNKCACDRCRGTYQTITSTTYRNKVPVTTSTGSSQARTYNVVKSSAVIPTRVISTTDVRQTRKVNIVVFGRHSSNGSQSNVLKSNGCVFASVTTLKSDTYTLLLRTDYDSNDYVISPSRLQGSTNPMGELWQTEAENLIRLLVALPECALQSAETMDGMKVLVLVTIPDDTKVYRIVAM